jgi:hypothetical protein
VYTRNCIESSNLSFTAKFDVTKTPDFERSQGFCGFWHLDFVDADVIDPRPMAKALPKFM